MSPCRRPMWLKWCVNSEWDTRWVRHSQADINYCCLAGRKKVKSQPESNASSHTHTHARARTHTHRREKSAKVREQGPLWQHTNLYAALHFSTLSFMMHKMNHPFHSLTDVIVCFSYGWHSLQPSVWFALKSLSISPPAILSVWYKETGCNFTNVYKSHIKSLIILGSTSD